jgi:hypothetical protein
MLTVRERDEHADVIRKAAQMEGRQCAQSNLTLAFEIPRPEGPVVSTVTADKPTQRTFTEQMILNTFQL